MGFGAIAGSIATSMVASALYDIGKGYLFGSTDKPVSFTVDIDWDEVYREVRSIVAEELDAQTKEEMEAKLRGVLDFFGRAGYTQRFQEATQDAAKKQSLDTDLGRYDHTLTVDVLPILGPTDISGRLKGIGGYMIAVSMLLFIKEQRAYLENPSDPKSSSFWTDMRGCARDAANNVRELSAKIFKNRMSQISDVYYSDETYTDVITVGGQRTTITGGTKGWKYTDNGQVIAFREGDVSTEWYQYVNDKLQKKAKELHENILDVAWTWESVSYENDDDIEIAYQFNELNTPGEQCGIGNIMQSLFTYGGENFDGQNPINMNKETVESYLAAYENEDREVLAAHYFTDGGDVRLAKSKKFIKFINLFFNKIAEFKSPNETFKFSEWIDSKIYFGIPHFQYQYGYLDNAKYKSWIADLSDL